LAEITNHPAIAILPFQGKGDLWFCDVPITRGVAPGYPILPLRGAFGFMVWRVSLLPKTFPRVTQFLPRWSAFARRANRW